MDASNVAGFVILLALALVLAWVIQALVSKNLEGLLGEILKLPDGTTFYARCFSLGLFLAALAGALGTNFTLKPSDPFMEYVWKVAGGLQSVCEYFFAFLLAYLVLVTILAAALRAKHEQ